MKFVVTKQHFDLTPGTVLEYVKESQCDTGLYGIPYLVARAPKGFLVTIPHEKVNTEVFSPFETVNS